MAIIATTIAVPPNAATLIITGVASRRFTVSRNGNETMFLGPATVTATANNFKWNDSTLGLGNLPVGDDLYCFHSGESTVYVSVISTAS